MSEISRRGFCKLSATGASGLCAASLVGCDGLIDAAADWLGEGLPAELELPTGDEISDEEHLLLRTSFGVHPADRGRLRKLGQATYLQQQLSETPARDPALALRTGVIDTPGLPRELLYEFPPDQIEQELARHTLLSAVYAKAQLREVLAHVFCDHFSIAIHKGACSFLLPLYVREAIRPNVLGSFRDLLGAVTRSAAMLVYLDGQDNVAARRPNENHARELLELHTLGVFGGYTQRDIQELARVMTGYVVERETVARGEVRFVADRHDDGAKELLGFTVAAGSGEAGLDQVLDELAKHPKTADHVTRALALHLVSDTPSAGLLGDVAAVFRSTDGDLRKVVFAMLSHPDFFASKGHKIKRPFHFIASVLRTLAARTHARGSELSALLAMGQRPFAWPTPDGAPREGRAWLGTLLGRFRFVFEGLLQETPGLSLPLHELAALSPTQLSLQRHVLGRELRAQERAVFESTHDPRARLALCLSGPAFQRY